MLKHAILVVFFSFILFSCSGAEEEALLSQNGDPILNCNKNLSISLESEGLNNNNNCDNTNDSDATNNPFEIEVLAVPDILVGMSQNTVSQIKEKAQLYGIKNLNNAELNANLIKFVVSIDKAGSETYNTILSKNYAQHTATESPHFKDELGQANIRIKSFLEVLVPNLDFILIPDNTHSYFPILLPEDTDPDIKYANTIGLVNYGPRVSFKVNDICMSYFSFNEAKDIEKQEMGKWTWMNCSDNYFKTE